MDVAATVRLCFATVASACLAACGSVVVGIAPVVTSGGTSISAGGSAPSLAAQYPVGSVIDRAARYTETKEVGFGTHAAQQRGINFQFADTIYGVCYSGQGQQGSTGPWPTGLDIRVSGRVVGHLALISAVELKDCTLTPLTKK
jgi:hypothetical protein